MKIVIIGLGTIGKTILKSLSGDGHTITITTNGKITNVGTATNSITGETIKNGNN